MRTFKFVTPILFIVIMMVAGISYAQHEHSGKDTISTDKAIDVVCGMTVGKSDSRKYFTTRKIIISVPCMTS